jgi:hypothetical protein
VSSEDLAGRRWTARRIILLVVVAALIVGLPGAAAAWSLIPRTHSIVLPPMPTPSAPPAPPTAVGEMTDARRDVVRTGIFAGAKQLSEAMLARDEARFLSVSGSPAARAMLRRVFHNLTQMHVTRYDVGAGVPAKGGKPGQWKADLSIDVCFVVPGCTASTRVLEPAVWQDTEAGTKLVSLSKSANGDGWFDRTQPWEVTDLYAAVGDRVVVAAAASQRGRLPSALAAAKKAISQADAYAVGAKPEAYVSYLAGPAEWKTWFGFVEPKWAAGYTTPVNDRGAAVVVNCRVVSASFLPSLLRHEFTHAASVYGTHYWKNLWWLIEGYAENAEHELSWDGSSVTRRYVDSGWNGRLPMTGPSYDASNATVTGQYGVAFLAVYRLEQRFGRAALIDFFNNVVRGGVRPETVSSDVFHTGWAAVQSDLLRYIKGY